MRNSIRTKLAVLLVSAVVLCTLCFWLVNVVLLPSYYQNQKMEAMENIYGITNQEFSSRDMSKQKLEKAGLVLDRISSGKGTSLYVFNLFRMYPESYLPDFLYPSNMNSYQISFMEQQIRPYVDYLFHYPGGGDDWNGREVLEENEKYGLYRVYEERTDTYNMELFGMLDNNSCIYLRTSYQSMDDSIHIFNKFILYIGVGLIVVCGLAVYFVSRIFTVPLRNITSIAKKMSDLDFNEKYEVRTKDEFGELGTCINTLSDKLEHTIQELKTANNELKRDIEDKIQIDEMRKEFLSNVSHELKTPIALIQGYAEGLMENVNEDAESRLFYCEVIADEADKMNQMVKKLLSLNQIEFGSTPVEFERFDVVGLIQSVLANTQILMEQKEITVLFRQNGPVYVWAEEYWIEQVVTNYVSNAIHHADGDRRIEIGLRKMENVVRIEIYNTGETIPEEELDKIWIKFYKVDKARTREYGGNGIGLSIVKAIMNMHNRDCGVQNMPGGVMFWFELDTSV